MKNNSLAKRKDLYNISKPEIKKITENRLNELQSLGMKEVGIGEFGIKNIISGLYIEQVWNYTDEKFNEYVSFVKDAILENELNKI